LKELTFDIFSGESGKDAVWIEAVEGMSNAQRRMEQIAAQKPGKYFLFSVNNGSVLTCLETFKGAISAPNWPPLKGNFSDTSA
jgi:hypothetical protein